MIFAASLRTSGPWRIMGGLLVLMLLLGGLVPEVLALSPEEVHALEILQEAYHPPGWEGQPSCEWEYLMYYNDSVVLLNMTFWGAKTPLPDVWSMLPNLTTFLLMETDLVTPFPSGLCDNLTLTALLLYYVAFTTPIPDSCYHEKLFALVLVGVTGPLEIFPASVS